MVQSKIAIDLDNVVFSTHKVLNRMFFRIFGTEIDWHSFKVKNGFYMATEEGRWLQRRFADKSFYKSLVPRPGAEILNVLTNGRHAYKIIYWTTRPSTLNRVTLHLLEDNRLPLGRIHYVNRKRAPKSKLNITRIEKIDVVVESDAEIVENLNGFCRIILFDTPSNGKCRCDKRIFKLKELKFLMI